MNAYDSYKAIDLPWLSTIPSGWDIIRNKNIFHEVKGTVGPDSASYTLLSLTKAGIIPRDVDSGKGKFPASFDTYKVISKGNMVFCFFDIDETPRTVGLSNLEGMLTGAYTVFNVANCNPRYPYYYYLSLDNTKALKPLYTGLRKTINVATFLGTKMPLPLRAEQDQIVRYLDWQVSKINKLIAAKKKEITRLKELQTSIIFSTITKGTNANTTFKDSGVNWIGNVPSHWSITQIKRYSQKIGSGTTPASSNLDNYEGGTINWIQSGDIYGKDNITSTEKKITNVALQSTSVLKIYEAPFIVIAMYGGSVGNIAISKIDACTNQACCCIKPNPEIRLKFLYYWISICKADFLSIAEGGGQPNISQGKIKNQVLVVPPLDEQDLIVEQLEQKCKHVKAQIDNINLEIAVLNEMRNKLIADVVTGQIDVRNIEIPDYEYVEEEADETEEDTDEETVEQEEE